jgi:hypothetical protein
MKFILCVITSIFLSACAANTFEPLLPVIVTDVEGEYVIIGRDTTPLISLVEDAEKNAENGAKDFCIKLGKEYKKRYVITSPMAPPKWAEATIHFRCLEKNLIPQSQGVSDSKINSKDPLYERLTNLKKLLDDGTITKEEFELQKKKLLNQN